MTTKIPVELSSTPGIVDGSNATAITIDSSERVGVGNASPDYRLVVRGLAATNDNIFKIEDSAGTKMASMEQDSSGNGRWIVCDTSGNADVLIHTAGTSYFNGGTVLIGATTSAAHGNVDELQIGDNTGNKGISINSANNGTGAIFFADGDSSLSGQLEYAHASDHLAIITGGNQRLRVDAHGLKFGSDSAEANALDDYEEGTWSPTLIAGTTNPTGGSYQARNGTYTKIGNRVYVTFYVGISYTNTPGGGIYMANLPYPVKNDAVASTHFPIVSYKLDLNGVGAFGVALANQSNAQIYVMADSNAWAALSWSSHTTSPLYLAGEFSYITT